MPESPEERVARLEYARLWRARNPNYMKEWFAKHPGRKTEIGRRYRKRHPERAKWHARSRSRRLKLDALMTYCGGELPSCAWCEIKDIRVLSIDHVFDDGNEHRKQLRELGTTLYQWLRQKKYPFGFQVLCMNCQFIKKSMANNEKVMWNDIDDLLTVEVS